MNPTKVALSPCIFELMSSSETEETEIAHLTHLQSVLSFLQKLNVEFDLYENAPYFPDSQRRPPISRYHFHRISCSSIYSKIQRKVSYSPIIYLSEHEESEIVSDYIYPENSETKESFLKYITYLNKNSLMYLLFIGLPNCEKPKPFKIRLPNGDFTEKMPIFSPMSDCSGQISSVISVSDGPDIFPNKNLCLALNEEFLRKRHTENKIPLIIEYGTEAALRNGFAENTRLSAINSKKQGNMRKVYSRAGKSPLYLSLDLESGGFEVFDYSGVHLGQFSFSGIQVKLPEPKTHKIYFS